MDDLSAVDRRRCPGPQGTGVFFWGRRECAATAERDGEDEVSGGRTRFFANGFTVFNVDQVDGFVPAIPPSLSKDARDAQAKAFFSALGADIRHSGDRAYYHSGDDHAQIPAFRQFRSGSAY